MYSGPVKSISMRSTEPVWLHGTSCFLCTRIVITSFTIYTDTMCKSSWLILEVCRSTAYRGYDISDEIFSSCVLGAYEAIQSHRQARTNRLCPTFSLWYDIISSHLSLLEVVAAPVCSPGQGNSRGPVLMLMRSVQLPIDITASE